MTAEGDPTDLTCSISMDEAIRLTAESAQFFGNAAINTALEAAARYRAMGMEREAGIFLARAVEIKDKMLDGGYKVPVKITAL